MQLRPLLMPPVLDEVKVELLTNLANEVINYIDTRRDFAPLIARFNELTGGAYDAFDFDAAMGSIGMDQMAKQAMVPEAPVVGDISREEFLEIIGRVFTAQGEEWESSYYLELLQRNLPHPSVMDLIYQEDLTPEEVLERALRAG